MNKKLFKSFFKVHSENVDNSDSLGFWKLTDKILETFLLENMPIRDNVKIVDFGGGTGRWLYKLDKKFKKSKFILVDLSEDMLAQAKIKIRKGLFTNNVIIVKSDIASVGSIQSKTANYVISTYNPLSFCDDPQAVINEAYRILKPGGRALITVQGYHNAIYSKINNFGSSAHEINQIFRNKMVQWTSNVPKLWQLSKEDMESMFRKSGFNQINSRGIACVTQPQTEDFDPLNKKLGELSKKLRDKKFFNTLLKIELSVGSNPYTVNRAMNILTIGVK